MTDKSPEPTPIHHSKANKVAVIVLLMAVILIGGWLLLSGDESKKDANKLGEFSQRTLKTGGYAYSFDFTKDSKEVKKESEGVSIAYLEGKVDKGQATLSLTVQPVEWPVIDDCGIVANDATQAFEFTVSGESYKVCEVSASYLTVFEAAGHKHQINVSSSDTKAPLDESVVKDILNSLKVSKS